MSSLTYYPAPCREALIAEYVGKSLRDVPTPAAIINVAAVRRNCSRMLEACKRLNLGWRAHVKTHKVRIVTEVPTVSTDCLANKCAVDSRSHPTSSWRRCFFPREHRNFYAYRRGIPATGSQTIQERRPASKCTVS